MANFLYYIGGCDQRPSQAGIAGAVEFSFFDIAGNTGVNPTNNVTIAAAGSPYDGFFAGDAFGGGGYNGTYNNNDNWTQHFNSGGFGGGAQFFVIGAVDIDQSQPDVPGQVNGMYDRTGTTQDLICHHGSKSTNYIVLSPGSVTKFGSQLDGTVLVWYMNSGALGEEANAIGLPMAGQQWPRGADSDLEAAAKMLYFGLGVFRVSSGITTIFGGGAG